MAETESAAKRREGPKGPVKPEPAPVEAEQDSEARARALVGLLHSESAAAAPPDERNGNGHATSALDGLQRSSRNGDGNGHRAVQPADLRTLQRLAGNSAVAGLMASSSRAPVQRSAIGSSPPTQITESPERKAAEKRTAEAVSAWIAAAPTSDEDKSEAAEGAADGVESVVAEMDGAAGTGIAGAGAAAEATAGGAVAEGAAEAESEAAEGAADGVEATATAMDGAAGTGIAGAGAAAEATAGGAVAEGAAAQPGAQPGPGPEAERAAKDTLSAANTERAEAAAEPRPPNVRLAGPSLGQMLGGSAVASAAAAGPFGLVAPIAGLVAGAAAESATGAAPDGASQARQTPDTGSRATPARTTRAGSSPPPGGARADAMQTRQGGAISRRGSSAATAGGSGAARSGSAGAAASRPASATAAAVATQATAGTALEADLAPVTPAAMDSSPAMAAATPPAANPPLPPQEPQAPPARIASGGDVARRAGTSPAAAAHAGTAGAAPRSMSAAPSAPSDPARPSPLVAAVQPAQGPSRPTASAAGSAGERAARAVAAAPEGAVQPMQPGFGERQASAGAEAAGGGGGRPRGGGGGGPAPRGGGGGRGAPRGGGGGGGGAPAAPKPVPLGDAALEQWRSASGEAISGTEASELTEAKETPGKVDEAGQEIDSSRRGEQPDFEADAKEGQPEMPQEPEKDQVLDTGPAEAAVQAVVTAGEARLADQTFKDLGTPPAYPGLNPSDYVPRQSGAYKAMTDLEERLAGEGLTDEERVSLTEQLEKAKAAVQEIGEKAQKGTAEPPPTVVDEGPASLDPPDPALGDLMGDVIARELGRVGERANEIRDSALATIKGKSVPAVSALGDEEAGTVTTELTTELNGIAEAAGVTEEQLKGKIEEQKNAVKAEEKAVEEGLAAASATATKQVEERTKEESEDISGAKSAVDTEIQQKQEAVQGPPDTEAINQKRDEFLGKVETVGAQAVAGIKSSLGKRESALDSTGGKQKTSAKQAANSQAAAIRRHWEGDEDAGKGMTEARPTVRWGTTRATAVDTEVGQKKTAAKTQSDGLTKSAQDTIKQSKNDVRDWAAAQEGRERSWWEKLWDSIVDWGNQAVASNEAWEQQRNADSRDKMGEDFKALATMKTELAKGNSAAAMKELGAMDAEQQKLANLYLKGGISSIEFVARSTIGRIKSRRAPELAVKIEQRAIAELGWEDLGVLAQQQGNSGFSPGVLGNQIRGAVSGLGTDESAVYAALGKANTAVERAALNKFYQATFGTSLDDDVRGDMSGRELDRALALKEGRTADAAAAAMAEAMEGIGTDEDTIRSQMRGKSPEEIKAIKAAYEKQTGRSLDTDLVDDMSGAELDNALALSSGDPLAADAAELQIAMEGAGTDEAGLEKVYDRIREEEEARAKREGLTPAELQAAIQDRNSKLKSAYNNMYGSETGGLDAALRDELDDADLGVMGALDEGDATKIDAAMANREHESIWYADDDKLEGIVRNQHKQADLEVNLELTAEKARMKAMLDSGDVAIDDYKKFTTDWDQRYKDRDKAVATRSRQNMDDLRGAYSSATNGTQTFDQLVAQETTGYSQLEIQDLVAAGGKLSDEKELYYATAGVGTDEDKIKEIFKGKTPAEIAALRAKYKNNLGRDMDDDVMSDLSGRENLDVGHSMKFGDPDTFGRQLAEAKTPEERQKILANMRTMMNERKSFEETGLVGSIFAAGADPMNSAAQLEQALTRAEEYESSLTAFEGMSDEEKALKKAELDAAKAKFEMNFSAANEAQEQVRKQIDAYTDAAVQVGAAIAAVAVTIVTAGTAGPVIAAAYGAMAAAAATVALKATLKGDAYGWEEFGADVAIGAVDAAVSAATAGAGKVIMQAMKKALAKQAAKIAAKEGVEQATESAAKKWLQEAAEESIEGALGGAPTAAFEAAIDDNTWKSGDPWGAIGNATAMGAGMGAGISVGAKAGIDTAASGYGAMKGALKSEPKIDAGTPDAPSLDADGAKTDAGTPSMEAPEPPKADLELPPAADPGVAAKDVADGKLPPGTTEADLDLPPGGVDPDAGTGKTGQKVGDVDPVTGKPGEAPGPTRPEPPPPAKAPSESPATTPVEPDAKGGKPHADDAGQPLSMDDLTTRYGMPADNVKALQEFAESKGLVLDIRPTTPHAEPMLRNGTALPKPMEIKAKTINELDVKLGLAVEDDLGKVGRFYPEKGKLPDDFDTLPPKLQDELKARLAQREEEYFDTFMDIADLLSEGKIDITPDGIIINKGLTPDAPELPFTGDHDLFDIRYKDGTALKPDDYKAAWQELEGMDVGVKHGSVVGWEVDDLDSFRKGQESYQKMMADHTEGGKEPLVRIGEGEPQAVWHEPAAPPREGGGGTAGSDADAGGVKAKQDAGTAAASTEVPGGTGSSALKGGDEGGVPVGSQSPEAGTPRPDSAVEELTEWPVGTVGQLIGDAKFDPAKNDDFFNELVNDTPGREVGMLYNEKTGEYVVFQGNEERVWIDNDMPDWMEDFVGDASQNRGDWRLVLHSHPVDASKFTPEKWRWPSGGQGDWRLIANRAVLLNKRVEAQIQYRTPDGDARMSFSYDPHADKPYRIVRPGEPPREFATIQEYEAVFEAKNGFKLREVPDDFLGRSEPALPDIDDEPTLPDIDDEPTLVRPRPDSSPADTSQPDPLELEDTQEIDISEIGKTRQQPVRAGDTQEMPALDPDKGGAWDVPEDMEQTQPFMQLPEERGTYDVPPDLRDTQEMPALDPDKAGTWNTPEGSGDTQPFMQLPEERGTYDVPPDLRDTQEMPARDRGQGDTPDAPQDSLDTRELPTQELVNVNDPGPGQPHRGLLRRVLDRAEPTLDWWFHPDTQRALRLGLIEPNQERDDSTSGVLNSRDGLGRYTDDPRKFLDFL